MLTLFLTLFCIPLAAFVLHRKVRIWRRVRANWIILPLWLLSLCPMMLQVGMVVLEFANTSSQVDQIGSPTRDLLKGQIATVCDDQWGPLYESGVVTQGIHGQSYGHYAVDFAGGSGTPIHSPICGQVTANSMDGFGNPTLVLENNRYKVTLLHGDWIVDQGMNVRRGQIVGHESNKGYTMNSMGQLCNNRPGCGYHTHIDVKRDGRSVDPRNLGVSGPIDRQVDMVATLQQPSAKPLRISWYDPRRGGVNCDSDCTTMSTGTKVTPERYGRTAACIKPWTDARKTVVIPGLGEFQCLDRGGAIKEHGDFIWIDLLLETPLVPFGSYQEEWYLK